jgi:hypothetical protein
LREVFLHAGKGSNRLAPMPVPERLIIAASGTPSGEALNVGQMYARFAQSIRDSAIRDRPSRPWWICIALVDAMKQASDAGREATFD